MAAGISRREFLIAAGGALAASCGGQHVASGEVAPGVPLAPDAVKPVDPGTPPPRPLPHVNLIPAENALAGAVDWRLRVGAPAHEIEGYVLRQSVTPGEAVAVAVSCAGGAAAFRWTLYRLGHYGGAGAREVASGDAVAPAQRAPTVDRATGLVSCGWRPAFTLVTDDAWATGLYLLKLVRSDGYDTWVPLVLRDARPPAETLVVIPTATWQAYNWFGGESLYQDDGGLTGSGRAFQVSYDRPYAQDFGAGNALRWDHRLAQFLEAQGEDVAYATDEDLDRDPALAARARAVILSAHDEYWSGGVRRALDAAVAGGTSLLLFGANAGYWQVRYGAAADGRDRRVITCYKDDAPRLDPAGPASPDLTVRFRDEPVSRPENALFGVMFQTWNTYGFPLAARDPAHWAFAGTGLAEGDTLPLVAGYEIDDTFDNGATPDGVEVLGEASFLPIYGDHVSRGRMVVRTEGSAVVFAAGGVDFTSALAGDTADARVQRIAANVLARALGRAAPDHLVTSQGVAGGAPQGPFASAVKTIAGAAFSPGDADGGPASGRLRQPIAVAACPDGSVAILDVVTSALRRVDAAGVLTTLPSPALLSPTGLAADALGNLYVADTGRSCIRKRTAAGAWSVVAGAPGVLGAKLGPGATARFMAPAGLALRGTALYVADVGANAVRKIDLADPALPVTAVGPALTQPTGVAVAPDGTVYAIEAAGFRVAALSGTAWTTVAGGRPGFADGRADAARLLPQLGLAVLPDGALAVSDTGNLRIRVIRAGAVTTLAGSGRSGTRQGTGDATDLSIPTGLAVDKLGRLLVADTGSSVVRLVTL